MQTSRPKFKPQDLLKKQDVMACICNLSNMDKSENFLEAPSSWPGMCSTATEITDRRWHGERQEWTSESCPSTCLSLWHVHAYNHNTQFLNNILGNLYTNIPLRMGSGATFSGVLLLCDPSESNRHLVHSCLSPL